MALTAENPEVYMKYFDLHCDSITECLNQNKPLKKNDLHIDLQRARYLDRYIQCYAVFIPDTLRGEEAFFYFKRAAKKLAGELEINRGIFQLCSKPGDIERLKCSGAMGAVLTVESGAALGGRLENIEEMKQLGVKMVTVTWNGENEMGTGAMVQDGKGLSDFGRQAVSLFEESDIVVDISHASQALFWDVAERARKPFVASHSNSKSCCDHGRNLTDRQFSSIVKCKGLVGLNFYKNFLNDSGDRASVIDILRHAEHFLALGGQDVLAIGGDLDGAEMPEGIAGIEHIEKIYELFLRHNFPEEIVKKIFFFNAANFFTVNNLL